MTGRVPDLAALYLAHRDAMHGAAAAVLAAACLADHANDAVSEAIESILAAPAPRDVANWEAFLVTAAKRKAIDRLRSAALRHAGPELDEKHDLASDFDLGAEVAEAIDRMDLIARLNKALARLGQRERDVLCCGSGWRCSVPARRSHPNSACRVRA